MGKKSFAPNLFQKCTINKVVEEILQPNKNRKTRRFLVADEVGLGKTIIAKNVIDELRSMRSKSKNITVVYVSSSLDITKQNKFKLTDNPENEIVQADRINLIFQNGLKEKGLRLISMTPGTSLSFKTSLGNKSERLHMACLIRNELGYSRKKLSRIFHGPADEAGFQESLSQYNLTNKIPRGIVRQIIGAWKKVSLKNGMSFFDVMESRSLEQGLYNEFVRKLRGEMAKTILAGIAPDLVIFDEFQKFSSLTEVDATGFLKDDLGGILLADHIPVLLLSATPYQLYKQSELKTWSNLGDVGIYGDLERVMRFLAGDPKKSMKIVEEIHGYGKSLKSLSADTIHDVLKRKASIEQSVTKFMARAERVNFENNDKEMVSSLFLSDEFKSNALTSENILEYLRLSKYCDSNRTLLSYWKSGVHSMSYQSKYKLIENAVERSRQGKDDLSRKGSLYTPLKKDGSQHIKLKYVLNDLFQGGENIQYLWLPPISPYYKGEGVFHEKSVEKNKPKKGLVFSSWVFVPKMVASELGSIKAQQFKGVKSLKLELTGPAFRKLLFPSSFLAGILSHKDFVAAKGYGELKNWAKGRVRIKLVEEMGFVVNNKIQADNSWQILQYCEFFNNDDKCEKFGNYCNGGRRGTWHLSSTKSEKRERLSVEASIDDPESVSNKINERTIEALAEIAISSPAVCLLRTIERLFQRTLNPEQWMYLVGFCLHDIRSYVNREGHSSVISKFGKGNTSVDKTFDYFRIGNFQAVLDEYLFQIFVNKSDEGYTSLLRRLGQVFGPNRSHCVVNLSNDKSDTQRVANDIVCCFGEGAEESVSRDLNREAFNSPFWPFALATTSIGQEGLDFHLYCHDIYHWNLPANPVSFEQREGRLTRFQSYLVRKNIVADQKNVQIEQDGCLWQEYFKNARKHSSFTDRYNLEMSPSWIYTPESDNYTKFNRHVLDLPCSDDRFRYEGLREDLKLYRLALGQPDQEEFLKELRSNPYLSTIDPRGIVLNFFPFKSRNRDEEVDRYLDSEEEVLLLIKDCFALLNKLTGNSLHEELLFHVKRLERTVRSHLSGENKSKTEFKRAVKALYHFVDPFDEFCDREPEVGYLDDLEKLKAA